MKHFDRKDPVPVFFKLAESSVSKFILEWLEETGEGSLAELESTDNIGKKLKGGRSLNMAKKKELQKNKTLLKLSKSVFMTGNQSMTQNEICDSEESAGSGKTTLFTKNFEKKMKTSGLVVMAISSLEKDVVDGANKKLG